METFDWIRSHIPKEDLLATVYDSCTIFIPAERRLYRHFTSLKRIFTRTGAAKPNMGSVEEIKGEFRRLKVRYLVTNPLDQNVERRAVETVPAGLLTSYSTMPQLMFTSHDGKHKIYKLPQAE